MSTIWNLPNLLSFLRVPLAFLFLFGPPSLRVAAIVFAGITDGLDGYIARRYQQQSRFGTFLDPMTDKFFVFTVLLVFLIENKIAPLEMVAMLSRDFAVAIFGGYLLVRGIFGKYTIEAFWCGKLFTTLQLFVLLLLSAGFSIPSPFYLIFAILGLASLLELAFTLRERDIR